jgi:hypothetical protein
VLLTVSFLLNTPFLRIYHRSCFTHTRPTKVRNRTNLLQIDRKMPKELNPDYVRMKLQEWLRFPSIDGRRAAITKAHQDTFRWVLSPAPSTDDSSNSGSDFVEWLRNGSVGLPPPSRDNSSEAGSDFVDWLRNGSGVYWIQGMMGSGEILDGT